MITAYGSRLLSPLSTTTLLPGTYFYHEKTAALSYLVDSRGIPPMYPRYEGAHSDWFLFLQIKSKSHSGIRTRGSNAINNRIRGQPLDYRGDVTALCGGLQWCRRLYRTVGRLLASCCSTTAVVVLEMEIFVRVWLLASRPVHVVEQECFYDSTWYSPLDPICKLRVPVFTLYYSTINYVPSGITTSKTFHQITLKFFADILIFYNPKIRKFEFSPFRGGHPRFFPSW